jgi:hypothetical protein
LPGILATAGLALGALPALSVVTAAQATTITGPLTATELEALNSGASYGPPSIATFPDGPYTVNSGTGATLSGGPDAADANSILLVLSASSVTALGSGEISLQFGNLTPIDFTAADFYSTLAAGFPTSAGGINGIANGEVNNISFSSSEHAAADITGFGTLTNNETLGTVTITSPINLRVDVFGDENGTIIGNAANSGAEGIDGSSTVTPPPSPSSVPEPASSAGLVVLALGLLGATRFLGHARR